MKIGETRPIQGTREVGRRTATRADAAQAPTARPADSASIMGIPEHEITPRVREAIMTLMEEVARLRDELRQTQARTEHLEQLADEDALVPVFNRRAFVRELARAMSYSARYGTPSSLLYYDINNMKQINDTHGHGAGDAVLARVADVLKQSVRDFDIVGRLGGDEFGVILAQADQAVADEKGASLAEEVRTHPVEYNGASIVVQVAFGAYAIQTGEDVDNVLDAADRAMYTHKNKPRGPNV